MRQPAPKLTPGCSQNPQYAQCNWVYLLDLAFPEDIRAEDKIGFLGHSLIVFLVIYCFTHDFLKQ